MDKLDRMIEEALADEDRALLAETGEQGYLALVLGQFRGRNGWVTWFSTLILVIYGLLAVWAGWHLFTATEVLAALQWGLGAAVAIIVVGMLKLNLLMTAQTDRVMRELKRVELMLAAREK
jgi:hypothetical protein